METWVMFSAAILGLEEQEALYILYFESEIKSVFKGFTSVNFVQIK